MATATKALATTWTAENIGEVQAPIKGLEQYLQEARVAQQEMVDYLAGKAAPGRTHKQILKTWERLNNELNRPGSPITQFLHFMGTVPTAFQTLCANQQKAQQGGNSGAPKRRNRQRGNNHG